MSPFPRVRRLRALAAHSVPPPVYAFLPLMRLSYVTSGSSGTLRRLRVQWRGLARRAWPAVAFKVCPLRAAPSARHLAAALHPLVANAGRSLCTQWPVWGSDASAFTIAGPDVSWWAFQGGLAVGKTMIWQVLAGLPTKTFRLYGQVRAAGGKKVNLLPTALPPAAI